MHEVGCLHRRQRDSELIEILEQDLYGDAVFPGSDQLQAGVQSRQQVDSLIRGCCESAAQVLDRL